MIHIALSLVCLPMALAGPTEKWTFTAKTNLSTVLQYEVVVSHDGSNVFVPRQSHIVAVDAQTGTQKWEYTHPVELNPALISPDNSLLFAVPHMKDKAEIVAISTTTGQLVRTFSQKGFTAKPALSADGKTLYVSMYGEVHVAAYDIATGTQNWAWRAGDSIGACDVTVGPAGNIYVASSNDGHFALDPSGNVLWNTDELKTGGAYCDTVFDGLGTRAAVTSTNTGVLFLAPSSLGGTYGNLYAMDGSTGKVLYMIQPTERADTKGINTMPSASYQQFYGVYPVHNSSNDDDLYKLFVGDKSSGKQLGSYELPGEIIYGPTPPYLSSSGDVVFVAGDKWVLALSPKAQLMWTFDLDVHTHFTHRIKASPTESVLFVTDGVALRAIEY